MNLEKRIKYSDNLEEIKPTTYKEEISKDKGVISCDSKNAEFSLLTHQKIVRDYIKEERQKGSSLGSNC